MNNSTGQLKLLVGTKNAGKIEEVRVLLKGLPVDLRFLRDFPAINTVDESGSSYAENALLKATSYAHQTGICALADDSGLEVEALGGEPGLFSARYAGAGAGDSERVELLLAELSNQPEARRTARFHCAVAIVDSRGKVLNIAEGICEGAIAKQARGHNGFGYDPIFVPEGYSQTFGELPREEKDRISHRAKALKLTRAFLLELLRPTEPLP
jgi:XTP/dITP diphosphohydrolase